MLWKVIVVAVVAGVLFGLGKVLLMELGRAIEDVLYNEPKSDFWRQGNHEDYGW